MGDSPREPDARDPTTGRGDGGETGTEQTSADAPGIRSSEEGGQPDSGADTADVEGAALGGVE
jgi:hypothetical protein